MADVVYVRDAKTGELFPIKVFDHGDGTFICNAALAIIKTQQIGEKNER